MFVLFGRSPIFEFRAAQGPGKSNNPPNDSINALYIVRLMHVQHQVIDQPDTLWYEWRGEKSKLLFSRADWNQREKIKTV